jgi:hypothetical protein
MKPTAIMFSEDYPDGSGTCWEVSLEQRAGAPVVVVEAVGQKADLDPSFCSIRMVAFALDKIADLLGEDDRLAMFGDEAK